MGGGYSDAPAAAAGSNSTTKYPQQHLPMPPVSQPNPVPTMLEACNHFANNATLPTTGAGSRSTDERPKLRLSVQLPPQTVRIADFKNGPAMKGLRQQCMRLRHRRHLQALADEKIAGVAEW